MESVKSTILINNYNNGLYLEQCLASCINQTHKNLQIILFDDNSTDNSIETINRYRNKIEFFVSNSKNRSSSGPLNQLNILYEALDVIKGDLIFLLDGDDFFDKTKVEKISLFSNKKNFDLIQDQPYLYSDKKIKILKIKNFIFQFWPFYPTSTMCFNKNVLKNIRKYELS